MRTSFAQLFEELTRFISTRGVDVRIRKMDVEKPGEFDGPSIAINPKHDLEARCYYLAHSFGSICQWSTDFENARKVLDDLRTAKKGAASSFEHALRTWRRFEETSSEHAVWVVQEIGRSDAIPSYTVFFRADIEAMTIFHRTRERATWPEFLAEWKSRIDRGEVRIEPFPPRPVPSFHPVRIETQEVQQERD